MKGVASHRTVKRPAWHAGELVVRPGRRSRTVAIQWHDSVGDLHYQELTPAQSRPYLRQRRAP